MRAMLGVVRPRGLHIVLSNGQVQLKKAGLEDGLSCFTQTLESKVFQEWSETLLNFRPVWMNSLSRNLT